MGSKPVAVPRGLKAAGQRLWTSVHEVYGLAPHEELLLIEACRTADRLEKINADLSRPRLADDRRDRLYREARAQQAMLARLVASLRLPDDESGRRPQRRGGARGSYRVGGA